MKLKLKDFSSFLNEEADVRKNTGLPKDFIRNSEEDAKINLGVTPDEPKQLELGTLLAQANQIMIQSIPLNQIEEKFTKLEEIASDVIKKEFKTIFEILPIELKLRLVRPGETVFSNLPKLGNKQTDSNEKPEFVQPETEETPVENLQETPEEAQSNEEDDFFSFFDNDSQEDSDEENLEEIINQGGAQGGGQAAPESQEDEVTNKDVAMAIDKTQILNMITQGAGKATKDIIKFSEIVSRGVGEIFGDNAQRILDIWGKISEEADKRDWVTPIDVTKKLFKDNPLGVSGAVDVHLENFNLKFNNLELIIESGNASKITIRAYGVDFPMLIHESVKGIYMVLQSPAIKKNPELAEEIKRATSSYKDEASDFRYGTLAQKMFRDFVNHCKDAGRYTNMVERVFFFLSRDKEVIRKLPDMSEEEFELKNKQNGKFSDPEFLEITESLFSVFDKQNIDRKLKFVINEERFVESIARTKIEEIIKEEVEFEEELEADERAEDLKKALPSENEPMKSSEPAGEEEVDEIEKLRRATAERETDYTNMSDPELMDLVFQAAADNDFEKARMIQSYVKKNESLIIIDNELKIINENKLIRG
jgi:hypothetical protein